MEPTGFWAGLAPADRRALAGSATRRSCPRGELLCREGDRSSAVLVLLAGHVRIVHGTPDGREVVVGVRGPGDVLGELAAIDAQPRSATVEALDDVEVLEVPGGRFAALCRTRPGISWALLLVLSTRLRSVGRQWLDLGGGAAARRVAAQLMQLAVQHGVRRGDDIAIAVPATQAELAMTAAISRESWARATRELRRRGVISTGRRQVTIHRMAELRRLAS
ncbi:Crp/Fnr family transcriptional regulator [Amycolatopsis australiensis]|uniref:cAMP-binding domain of CRP or a regulatory subunit of cAMP-dependent protein kinases n=1 Tax=Amycolatopsis australiensis TaxID=546364 RepID=A0A1K1RMP6_9PSEU|nr:Crp/Fnr family transcriptional regulator [Amycolatopsis australiensis]SFW73555.1 cAMP-binding domain of CRP or a regulatory subunit of cAMP-dependent protein kinases [Amycolatopsis australiensis]